MFFLEFQPKYIDKLLKASEQRKKEQERRLEKKVQAEREAEQGLYDDKEAFVTSAYLQKMKEMREEEERERRQAALEGSDGEIREQYVNEGRNM